MNAEAEKRGRELRKRCYQTLTICSCWVCRWVLLEVLDKVSPGSVNWKGATKPPIKMPFKKVENCNQAISIGKSLKFSLVNVSGKDLVEGNKKLTLGTNFFLIISFSVICAANFVFASFGCNNFYNTFLL